MYESFEKWKMQNITVKEKRYTGEIVEIILRNKKTANRKVLNL